MAADRSILIQGLIELQLAGKGGPEAEAQLRKISAQANTMQGEFKGAEKAVDATTASFTRMASAAKVVAGIFAAGVVTNFLRDSLVGFARTERQALAVERQINALGQAAEGAGFRSFIEDLSKASGIVDDELVPAFQRALATFKDYGAAQEALSIASKFAAAGIGDVASNVEALNRFFLTGSARSLTAFNVNVKSGEDAVLGLNEGLKLVKDQLAITGDGFDDSQKFINDWARRIDEAHDAVGRLEAGLISIIQKSGEFVGTNLSSFLNPENIVKEAEGQAIIDSLAKQQAESKSKLSEKFADEQKRREIQKAKETNEKIAEDRLELERKTEDAILDARIEASAEFSVERYQAELKRLQNEHDLAVAEAIRTHADVDAVDRLFGQQILNLFTEFATGRKKAELDASEEIAQIRQEEVERYREATEEKRKIEEEWQAELMKFYNDSAKAQIQLDQQIADEKKRNAVVLLNATSQFLAVAFEGNKTAAIAEAIINTAAAVVEALPNYPLAALVAATGAVQIAKIRSTTLGSSGSGGDATVFGSGGAAPQFGAPRITGQPGVTDRFHSSAPQGGIVVNINGGVYASQREMTKLARKVASAARADAGKMR